MTQQERTSFANKVILFSFIIMIPIVAIYKKEMDSSVDNFKNSLNEMKQVSKNIKNYKPVKEIRYRTVCSQLLNKCRTDYYEVR